MGGGDLPGKQMLEGHGGIEATIPHFRGAVASSFKSEVVLYTFIAALRRSSGVVLQFPLLRISGRDVDESGVVLHGKMDSAAPIGVRAGTGAGAGFGAAVHERAAELGAMLGKFHTVMAHFKTSHTEGHTVWANGKIIFILELYAPAIVEVNEGHNAMPAAVFVDGHSVMGGVQNELGDFVLR